MRLHLRRMYEPPHFVHAQRHFFASRGPYKDDTLSLTKDIVFMSVIACGTNLKWFLAEMKRDIPLEMIKIKRKLPRIITEIKQMTNRGRPSCICSIRNASGDKIEKTNHSDWKDDVTETIFQRDCTGTSEPSL